MGFYIGLDLGQAQDYTAIAVLERVGHEPPKLHEQHLRHLERFPLGTPYPKIVARVRELTGADALQGRAVLGVDATGVGRPVVDLLIQAKLPVAQVCPVTITGGDTAISDENGWRVPKRDLVGVLQVLLHQERLKIARGLPEAQTLVDELLSFQVKISEAGRDSYGAWREGQHDDLVLAAAIACWLAEQTEYIRPPSGTYTFSQHARTLETWDPFDDYERAGGPPPARPKKQLWPGLGRK